MHLVRHSLLLLPLLGVLAPAADMPPPPLVVTRALLWTPQGSQPDRELIIADGRVVAIGESGRLERPAGARVIDAAGDTLLPGLIDAHVHLVPGSRLPPGLPKETVYAANARHLLRSGVTAGRVHLMPLPELAALQAAQAETAPSPRLQFGGPALFGGRPDWNSPTGNVWGVQGVDDAVAKVRRLQESGASWIALHDLTKFQPGEAEAIVAEARRLNLGVLAAGDRFAEIERALTLGVDSLDYQDRGEASQHPPELLRRLRETPQTFLVPMIGFPRRWTAYRNGEFSVDDHALTEFLPPQAARFVIAALQEDRTKPPSYPPKYDEAQIAKFRELHAAGLPLVTGTDCGSPAHFHADAIWQELEAWRQLGMPPDDIVRGATERAARLLRTPDLGHLGVGARGDFVLYRGRIGDGPFHQQRVRAVGKGGRLFVEEGRWIESAASETAEFTREFHTNAGPLEITVRGRHVTGRYRISVKQPADEGVFTGTIRDGLVDAVWSEKSSSGRMFLAFDAGLTRFHSVFNNSARPTHWFGDWFGHSAADLEKIPAETRARLRSDWQ